jgi:hypothetical protein
MSYSSLRGLRGEVSAQRKLRAEAIYAAMTSQNFMIPEQESENQELGNWRQSKIFGKPFFP